MRLALLLAGAVVPLLLWASLPLASEGAGTRDRADDLQRRIDASQRRVESKRRVEGVLTSDVARYSARIAGLQDRIDRVGVRLADTERELTRQHALLEQVQSQLRRERARLARLRMRLRLVQDLLARRMVELYKADRPDLVTVILNSDGFASLLERTEFLRRISDNDRRIIGVVRRARDQATASAQKLGGLAQRRRAVADAIQRRRDSIASDKHDLVTARTSYDRLRSAKARLLDKTRSPRRRAEDEVRSLQAQQAKIRHALQAAQTRNAGALPQNMPRTQRGSGQFRWPINGTITSPFCESRAWEACHPGLDIGAPEGTPIRAAAAGKVVLMQPVAASGGYGNYTCVQHSASLSTCYAHQSRFGTTTGATLRQGQVLGYVGNTGRSFGAHLHFEARIDGSVVNPLNYL